jgi:Ca2+-binding EF-hand superfamily protein
MKITRTLLLTAIAAAIALPTAALAAKADRKKGAAVTFTTADKDNDGHVTQAEYIAALKASLGEESAKTKFGSLDKNSDGKLSKEEFGPDATEKKKRRKKN